MSSIRTPALKVGLFVLFVAGTLVLALVLVGGIRLRHRASRYFVETNEAVSGISINSIVTLRGVQIGRVKSIELDHSNFASVRIGLEVNPDIVIPGGSQAYFERIGLTGERAINIDGGTLADGRILPGGEIPRGHTDLEHLETRAQPLADELEATLADLHATVKAAKQRIDAVDPEHVAAIIDAVDPERVRATLVAAESASKRLAVTALHLRGTVDEARQGLASVETNVDAVARGAKTTLERADASLQKLSSTIEHVDAVVEANQADIRVTLHNLRSASEQAKALLDALRNNPSLLLRRPRRKRR